MFPQEPRIDKLHIGGTGGEEVRAGQLVANSPIDPTKSYRLNLYWKKDQLVTQTERCLLIVTSVK